MTKENVVVKKVRRGNTQKNTYQHQCHSRVSLSGIPTLDIQNGGDPRLRASGMTPLFNKGAFTLIELLVVVLIIGILAAVAVPQYQKAVYKARATEAVIILKALVQAEETYFLANGTYTNTLDNLDVSIPESKEYLFSCSTGNCQASPKKSYKLPVFEFTYSNHESESPTEKKSLRMCVALYKNETADSICKSMTRQEPISCKTHCYYSIDL